MAPFSGSLPFKASSESIHLFFSLLYVGMSIYFLLRNRAAVVKLRHGLKIEGVEEKLRPELVLVKSCSSHQRVNPEAALESAASRSTYRR
jgi:hypothetical protein